MKKVLILSLSVAVFSITACSNKSERQERIGKAISANMKADSLLEWEASEHNPEKVFAEWNEKLVKKEIKVSGLCEEFTDVATEDLVLFENEIRSETNVALLAECREALLAKLDDYWIANQPPVMNVNTRNQFKFPDNVQTRDLSDGYFAYTGDVGPKEVVLTYDDGPSGLYTERILQDMAQVNAKAIFFMTGNNTKKHADIVHKIAEHGHALGAHSMKHMCLAYNKRCEKNNNGILFTPEQAMKDIRSSLNEIYKILGWVDPFFRFPYGESSPELKKLLRENQVGEFYWSVDSNDWRSKDIEGNPWTPTRMIESIMKELNANPKKRGMILVHDIQAKTAEAVPGLLQRLYYEGYSLVLLKPENTIKVEDPKILRSSDSSSLR